MSYSSDGFRCYGTKTALVHSSRQTHRFRTFISFRCLCSCMTGLFLSGCSLPGWITQSSEQILSQVETAIEQTNDSNEVNSRAALTKFSNRSWLGVRKPVRIGKSSQTIPKGLHRTLNMTFAEPVGLREVGQLISNETGVTLFVRDDVPATMLSEQTWTGSALEALNHITGKLGYHWQIDGDRVEIFHTDLAVWTILAPTTVTQWKGSVGLSGSVQSSDGGSNIQARDQVVVSLDTSDFWNQIENTVTAMLSPAGRVALDRNSAELTVIDTPRVLDRVDDWVRKKNREFATQVLMHVDLYEIDRSENANAGFNFDGFAQEALGKSAARIEFKSDESGALLDLGLLHNEGGTVDTSEISLILRQAAGGANVAKLTSTILRGINGQPIPVYFGDEIAYVERREVVQNEGLVTVRLLPGKLQNGIALNVIPRVLPNSNRMMLNITVRTTRVKALTKFPANAGANDPSVQLPDLESRSILLPVLLRSGETLFVAGLDTVRTNENRSSGIFSKSSSTDNQRSSLVMLITPFIIPPSIEITQLTE